MVANFILEDSNQLNLNLLFFFLRRVTKIGHENTEQAGWDDGIPGVAATDSVFFFCFVELGKPSEFVAIERLTGAL